MPTASVTLTDESKVVRAIQREEPEAKRQYDKVKGDFEKLDEKWNEVMQTLMRFEGDAKKILAESRKGYTISDKKLKELSKDKRGNKEKIENITKLRKYFYETGMYSKSLVKMVKSSKR